MCVNTNVNISRNISNNNNTNNNNKIIDLYKTDIFENNSIKILNDTILPSNKSLSTSISNNILVLDLQDDCKRIIPDSSNIKNTTIIDQYLQELITRTKDDEINNITTMQLSFPYTLVKRSNFPLNKLIESTLYHKQQEQLLNIIENSNKFIFYDNYSHLQQQQQQQQQQGNNSSTIKTSYCEISTYHIIKKFIIYLKENCNEKMDCEIYYLSYNIVKDEINHSSSSSTETNDFIINTKPFGNATKSNLSPKTINKSKNNHLRKLSLKLQIPGQFSNDNDQGFTNRISKSTSELFSSSTNNTQTQQQQQQQHQQYQQQHQTSHSLNLNFNKNNKPINRHFLKKDSCYYSPSTLNKYFSFKKPTHTLSPSSSTSPSSSSSSSNGVEDNLPTWLNFLSSNDFNENDCLLKILNKYENLEKLENDRLFKSMDSNNRDSENDLSNGCNSSSSSNNNNNNASSVYSINYETLNTNHFYHLNSPITTTPPASPPQKKILNNSYVFTQGIKYFNKNRYNNILPYEHTRVKLLDDSPIKTGNLQTNNESESGAGLYFNANHISVPKLDPNFKYIATQAPLPTTFDDFWNVCYSQNIHFIVSLNSMEELNLKKWDQYWNNDSLNSFHVDQLYINDCVEGLNGCILREFELSKKKKTKKNNEGGEEEEEEEEKKIIYHLQFSNWFDSASLVSQSIIEFIQIKNKLIDDPEEYLCFLKQEKNATIATSNSVGEKREKRVTTIKPYESPLLVLCSAGCGRTGVFITIDFLLNLLNDSNNPVGGIDFWNFKYDLIFIVVNELRRQRISMVQNLQQFIMCYQTIIEYLTKYFKK